jgi:hypothetical protein
MYGRIVRLSTRRAGARPTAAERISTSPTTASRLPNADRRTARIVHAGAVPEGVEAAGCGAGAALCFGCGARPGGRTGGRSVRIANPMYDAVFKHLLEDPVSSRLIVATIIGEEIDEIDLEPQESSRRVDLADPGDPGQPGFTVQRLDFAATVRTAAGERLRVMIEVQKSHYSDDVVRFRRYLGARYAGSGSYVTVSEGGAERRRALPLLTIYFLGQRLANTEATVLKVARRYVDAVTGEELPRREDFVEALTHDCYVVQVPRLSDERRDDLEKLLSIFDQRLRTADRHVLDLDHTQVPDAYAPVLRRLEQAAADAAVAESMTLEDEMLGAWARRDRAIAEARETIAEKDEAIAEKDEAIAEAREAIAEAREAIAEKDEALRRQQAEIDALRRQVEGR